MADPYTHSFEIQFGEDFDIEGNIEFNIDGKVSYETEEALSGVELQEMARIQALFQELKRIFDQFGSIRKFELNEK